MLEDLNINQEETGFPLLGSHETILTGAYTTSYVFR